MSRNLASLTPSLIRTSFEDAARLIVEVTGAITPDQWDQPGLGVWSVRELTGHTSRGLSTVLSGLDTPPASIDAESPLDYFRSVYEKPHDGMHDAVAARGRESAAALGDEPAVAIWQLADRVLNRLATTADDTPCTTFIGGMRLIDYLPSRVVELTVHTLDLARATGQSVAPPDSSWLVTMIVVLALADPGRAVFALTGRGEYNVFA
jgi:hypothetical protein